MDKFIVWLAQGFGIGRVPFAPGTWGSVLGVGWFLLLVAAGNWWGFAIGLVAAVLLAVHVCGRAEEIMQRRDPPSVVLDEIVVIPICMISVLVLSQSKADYWLELQRQMFTDPERGSSSFFAAAAEARNLLDPRNYGLWTLCALVLFRLFDIWKPWPIRQSQRLPGGWGVVMDDVLAAVYVNLVMLAAWGVMRWVG